MTSCPKCGADRSVRLGDAEANEPTSTNLTEPEEIIQYRCLACKHEWKREDDAGAASD